MNLFCFAHAGGTTMSYNLLKRELKHPVNLILVELPGRGTRFSEPLLDNMEDMLEDVYANIKQILNQGEFAFIGHSMGGRIAFEMAHKIYTKNRRLPKHLFISSAKVPHTMKSHWIHELPDEQFFEQVYKLGGTSREIFDDHVLRKTYLPVLRADFKALELFESPISREPLDSAVTVLYGEGESFLESEMSEWGTFFNSECTITTFPGDHFYIFSQISQVSKLIMNTLFK
ncbi:thioesterase II family protein [Paenibacillus amylolyticus]|uniref:thioesterase II family protein n=1 Tax=Paenibacillus amylolyticus TaxID=1451 RepID=UPI003EBC97C1